jgi:ribosomal protein L18E
VSSLSKEVIERLLKEGKMVVVVGKCESKTRVDVVGDKSKVVVVVRE